MWYKIEKLKLIFLSILIWWKKVCFLIFNIQYYIFYSITFLATLATHPETAPFPETVPLPQSVTAVLTADGTVLCTPPYVLIVFGREGIKLCALAPAEWLQPDPPCPMIINVYHSKSLNIFAILVLNNV